MTTLSQSRLDLLLHPVRLRILVALGAADRTTREIATLLDDIPTSSIYRHIQTLLDAGILDVVSERHVRGAVEKTLRVSPTLEPLRAEDFQSAPPDALRRAFLAFMMQLYQEFDYYLRQSDVDLVRDLLGFTTVRFYATDEEWIGVGRALNTALWPLLSNPPGNGRRRRRLATVALFGDTSAPEKE